MGQSKRQGEPITYTATIQNTNPTDADTNVIFSNDLTGNANLTFVGGPVQTQPIARNDTFGALGNVQIDVPVAIGLIANDSDPDVGNGTSSGLTISAIGADNSSPFSHTTANGGIVEASATNGSFKYNPPAGFEGCQMKLSSEFVIHSLRHTID